MIRQIIKFSLILSFIVTALWCLLYQDVIILGLFLGSLWGCLNLYLIEVLMKALLMKKNIAAASGLIFIKFPLLYGLGYKLLTFTHVDPWFFMGGFSLIFGVVLARSVIPRPERVF